MNTLKNRVQLIGNLGQDPELITFDGGKKKVNLRLATNDSFKNSKGERVDETIWHNVIVWGKQAEIAKEYLKKGSEIAIEGKLVNRVYEDKEGNNKYITEIVLKGFLMLDKKKETAL
jgi:single-strand DNA-binding protein